MDEEPSGECVDLLAGESGGRRIAGRMEVVAKRHDQNQLPGPAEPQLPRICLLCDLPTEVSIADRPEDAPFFGGGQEELGGGLVGGGSGSRIRQACGGWNSSERGIGGRGTSHQPLSFRDAK